MRNKERDFVETLRKFCSATEFQYSDTLDTLGLGRAHVIAFHLALADRKYSYESYVDMPLHRLIHWPLAEIIDRLVDVSETKTIWVNGCDRTVPAALRYLAEHPRPRYGQSDFNAEHLYQLAGEIEQTARNSQK